MITLSFRTHKVASRSGKPQMQWALRNGKATIARYQCSPDTFDPDRLCRLVNLVPLTRELIERGLLK